MAFTPGGYDPNFIDSIGSDAALRLKDLTTWARRVVLPAEEGMGVIFAPDICLRNLAWSLDAATPILNILHRGGYQSLQGDLALFSARDLFHRRIRWLDNPRVHVFTNHPYWIAGLWQDSWEPLQALENAARLYGLGNETPSPSHPSWGGRFKGPYRQLSLHYQEGFPSTFSVDTSSIAYFHKRPLPIEQDEGTRQPGPSSTDQPSKRYKRKKTEAPTQKHLISKPPRAIEDPVDSGSQRIPSSPSPTSSSSSIIFLSHKPAPNPQPHISRPLRTQNPAMVGTPPLAGQPSSAVTTREPEALATDQDARRRESRLQAEASRLHAHLRKGDEHPLSPHIQRLACGFDKSVKDSLGRYSQQDLLASSSGTVSFSRDPALAVPGMGKEARLVHLSTLTNAINTNTVTRTFPPCTGCASRPTHVLCRYRGPSLPCKMCFKEEIDCSYVEKSDEGELNARDNMMHLIGTVSPTNINRRYLEVVQSSYRIGAAHAALYNEHLQGLRNLRLLMLDIQRAAGIRGEFWVRDSIFGGHEGLLAFYRSAILVPWTADMDDPNFDFSTILSHIAWMHQNAGLIVKELAKVDEELARRGHGQPSASPPPPPPPSPSGSNTVIST